MLERIAEGRTDLVFEFVAQGNPASAKSSEGASLIQWCAYYGDVSAIRFLLAHGESLRSLGSDLGLNGAAFHGHWRHLPVSSGKRRRREGAGVRHGRERRRCTLRFRLIVRPSI